MKLNNINKLGAKIVIVLVILSTTKLSRAQTNYFRWDKVVHSTNNILDNTGICFDAVNRLRFVATTTSQVSVFNGQWSSPLNVSSLQARSGTNLIFHNSKQFYIAIDNKIHTLEWNGSSYTETTLQTLNILTDSKFAIANNYLYYIDNNSKKIYSYSLATNTNQLLTTNCPKARLGSDIKIAGNNIFFIGSTNHICQLKYTNNSWLGYTIYNTSINPLNNNIEISTNSDKIFYINDADNQVYNYIYSGQYSGSVQALKINAVPANPNSSIKIINDLIVYQDCFNHPRAFFWTEQNSWNNYELSASSYLNPSGTAFGGLMNDLFFESSNNTVERIFFNQKLNIPYVKSTRIFQNGTKLKPININYISQFCTYDDSNYFFAPHGHYNNQFGQNSDLCGTQAQNFCPTILSNHLSDIVTLGFDGIRFNGPELIVNDQGDLCVNTYKIVQNANGNTYKIYSKKILTNSLQTKLINQISYLIDLCAQKGLQVNLFTGLDNGNHHGIARAAYQQYLIQLCTALKFKTNILCYTITLEPDIHIWDTVLPLRDENALTKESICNYYSTLYDQMKLADPNHLITVGFWGPSTTLFYDPGVIKADFFTLHQYSDDRFTFDETCKRKILWFSKTMNKLDKPWIIGESGAVAHDETDSVYKGYSVSGTVGDESQQELFAIESLNNTFGCGSSSYSWWSYKNYYWNVDDNSQTIGKLDFFGLYDHFGNKKKIIQNNTFSNYQPVLTNNNCPIPNNYHTEEVTVPYNIYTGKIVDENNLPIENATIVAKDTKFGSDENRLCFSDSQGNFIIHFKGTANSITVSALGKLTTVIWKYDEDPVNIITLTSAECNQLSANRIANLDENEIKPEGYQYSIDEISTIVYLYPNPTEDQIEIKSDLNKFNKIDIFSPTFKLIFSKEFNLAANKTAINFSSYSRGVYYVRIHLLDGSISTVKLIKI